MNNSHTIKINELCRESLFEALIILMRKQPIDKISITELCKKAGVSRMAFYKNFESKEAILMDNMEQILEKSLDTIKSLDLSNTYNSSIIYFKMIKDNKDFFEIIFKRGRNEKIISQIFTYLYISLNSQNFSYDLTEKEIKPFSYYRGAGLVYLAIYWIENCFEESIEEMAKLATRFDLK